MEREEMISEISMRRNIPVKEVEAVLDEEDAIFDEEIIAYEQMCLAKKKKKKICFVCTLLTIAAIGTAVLFILEKKEKIDIQNKLQEYKEKIQDYKDKLECYKDKFRK